MFKSSSSSKSRNIISILSMERLDVFRCRVVSSLISVKPAATILAFIIFKKAFILQLVSCLRVHFDINFPWNNVHICFNTSNLNNDSNS